MLPFTASPSSASSLFDSILEQCSLDEHPSDYPSSLQDFSILPPEAPLRKESSTTWFMLQEPDLLEIPSQNLSQNDLDPMLPQIEAIRSVREQQENKVEEFLYGNIVKSTKKNANKRKELKKSCKLPKSMSPRKTKRIEKDRPLALINDQ